MSDRASRALDMLVGYVLIGGVCASFSLIVGGLVWHWAATGTPRLDYDLSGTTVFRLVVTDVRQLVAGAWRPRLLVNLGLAILLLTPYARVLASMLYFAGVEHDWKYAVFTGFVLVTLTYSLFLTPTPGRDARPAAAVSPRAAGMALRPG